MRSNAWVALAECYVLPDIGQLTAADRRALERAVRDGRLVKWRAHWFPVAGAAWGLGPLKTCYGTEQAFKDATR